MNPCINDGLCQEWENELQQAPDKQPKYQLAEEATVAKQVFPKKANAIF
ncbi:hypothetical protein N425_08035 [Tannerella sp. oral taxon BU063 isolate Cell 2]|uniref:Uncharacterized protein n=1 Tax=Tannerella sp. oral taxon BU063 isolate Cell 2 TaxID=1411148 RepID=W2C3H9_9BACT|nr:hypothetical protein N425_08035 [Tannerella sp. oral taxon BU063 isolate Cell 2]